MKAVLLLLIALCSVALAQDINGVSLGGTLDAPTIINHHPSKAVLGWVTAALDSAGNVIRYEEFINAGDLAMNTTSIPAGTEWPMSQGTNRVRVSAQNGFPQTASRLLDSVLFMDGEVAGPDNFGRALSVFQSQLDNISTQDQTAALHAPLAYSRKLRPVAGKLEPRDYGYGYGPTLNYYIGEILLANGTGDVLTPYGWRDLYYDSDPPPQTGVVINPPNGAVFTNSVGGTAVCGMDSPYAGQGVGGYDLGYIMQCPASNYSLVGRTGSNRADGVMDRIIQTGNVYNYNNGNLQNRDVMYEGCFPGDSNTLGTPVVVTSQGWGCR